MTAALILAIGVALAFAALCGYLVWQLDAQTRRADQEAGRRKAIAARNKQLGQIARDKQAECMRLAAIANAEATAHEQTKADLKQGGWVQLPSDEQIEAGSWR